MAHKKTKERKKENQQRNLNGTVKEHLTHQSVKDDEEGINPIISIIILNRNKHATQEAEIIILTQGHYF